MNSSRLTYRAEIDGLRAIAVASVILYHARIRNFGKDWFEGGFIGVDIFFVISGYLITRIIIQELQTKGHFSFSNFYLRRTRRILPALIFVILFCIIFSYFILLPGEIEELSRAALSSIFFVSNFFYYEITTVYGAESSLLKPLLHTWSLSVEEQFYIVFPFLSVLIYKFCRKYFLLWLIILGLLSLYFAEVMYARDPDLNFYLPFSRFWELLIGSIIAYAELNNKLPNIEKFRHVLPLFGIVFIFCSVLFFDENTPHPSFYTLLPTIGAALIICFSSKNDLVGLLLGSKPLVWIGLISYSAYLWHFPIFAFARIGNNDLKNEDFLIFILVTIILSAFTYKMIEKPFRVGFSNTKFFWSSAFITFPLVVLLSFLSFNSRFYNLWIELAPKKLVVAELMINSSESPPPGENRSCVFRYKGDDQVFLDKIKVCNKKYGSAVYVLGDSHARNVFEMFRKGDQYNYVVGLVQGGCRPNRCHRNAKWNQYDFFEENLSQVIRSDDVLIFHQSGSHLISDVNDKNDSELTFDSGEYSIDHENIDAIDAYLSNTAQRIAAKVVWLGPYVEYRYDPKIFRQLSFQGIVGIDVYLKVNPNSSRIFSHLNRILDDLKPSGYNYIAFENFYEVSESAIIDFDGESCFQFSDRDHFSSCAEFIIGQKANYAFVGF